MQGGGTSKGWSRRGRSGRAGHGLGTRLSRLRWSLSEVVLCLATFDAVTFIPRGVSQGLLAGRRPVASPCSTAVHWCRLFAHQLENLSRGCSVLVALLLLLLLLDTDCLFHVRHEMAARTGAALPPHLW